MLWQSCAGGDVFLLRRGPVVVKWLGTAVDGVGGVLGAHAEDGQIRGEQALHPVLGGGGVVVPVPQELAVGDSPGVVVTPQAVDHAGAGEAVAVLAIGLDPGEGDAVRLGGGRVAVYLDQQVGEVVAGAGAGVGQAGGDAVDVLLGRA